MRYANPNGHVCRHIRRIVVAEPSRDDPALKMRAALAQGTAGYFSAMGHIEMPVGHGGALVSPEDATCYTTAFDGPPVSGGRTSEA